MISNPTQLKKLSDEALMVQLMDHHSHPAVIELHRRYSKKLLGYFYNMLQKDEDLAQDFVQELFLKIIEKKHLFDPNKKFYSWLFTIAGNMCKTSYRKPKHQSLSTDGYELNHLAQADDSPLEKEEFQRLLTACIDQLEEAQKNTFVLRYFEHFSLQEISEITETSLGTVKSRLFYASRKIMHDLQEYNPRFETNTFKLI